jgi:hypothetical protein
LILSRSTYFRTSLWGKRAHPSCGNKREIKADDADIKANTNNQLRFDNNIAYRLSDSPMTLKYNHVYYINDAEKKDNSMQHEFGARWTRDGVQPYIENVIKKMRLKKAHAVTTTYS